MRKASEMVDQVVYKLIEFIKPGMMERDIIKKIPEFFEEAGCYEMSFSPIVASGPNGSMPHYSGDKRVIEKNDVIILDLGGRHNGYCSDTTRTLFVGTPTDEQKKVYETVRRRRQRRSGRKAGATGQDVDRAARKVIVDAGYGDFFFNRVGHGIGLAVHESPLSLRVTTSRLNREMFSASNPVSTSPANWSKDRKPGRSEAGRYRRSAQPYTAGTYYSKERMIR
jgi:Xaa-Pro aminopeptidase